MWSNQFHRHLADVEILAANGVPAPPEWVQLRESFTRYTELANSAADKLAAEVIAPSGADVAELRALALAEESATSVDDAAVSDVVRARVHSAMVELYAPHADRAYRAVAASFDAAADKFTRAAKAVDVLADPATLVTGSSTAREAWFAAPVLAGELDDALVVLAAAGRLAGLPAADDEIEILIPLTVDNAGKLHRRRLWEGWAATGRCGRWSALHALGGTIRAASRPAKLTPLAPPRPLQMRWVQGTLGGGEKLIIDPEDDPKAAVPEDDWSVA
jgi:hypothetical protein